MPTAATHTYTLAELEPQIRPELSVEIAVNLVDGTYAKGTVLGQVTASKKFAAYATGASDGSQNASAVLKYACTVASGVITLLGSQGEPAQTAPVFVGGYFRSEDLTGLDAAGLADMGGHIVYGDLTTGLVRIP